MKILHLISSGGMYGAEAVILTLLRAHNQEPYFSFVAILETPSQTHLQLYEAATKEGLRAKIVPCSGAFDRNVMERVRQLAAETRADIVHAHGYKADVYCFFAFRGSKVACVSTCHTWYDNDFFLTAYGLLDRAVLRTFARVAAVSQEVLQRLLKAGVLPTKIHFVRNGIDLRPFQDASPELTRTDGVPVVGLVGRLSSEKGVDLFLQAAAKVLAIAPSVHFLVAGEGPERAQLEAMIVRLGIGASITLLGRRDNMAGIYASFSMMVSASRQEGLPIALLEGMASGLPIIATAVGEVPAAIEEDKTGLLIPPNDVDALTRSILRLLNDPSLQLRLGASARERVEESFSAAQMAEAYHHLYEEALREGVDADA